MSSDQQLSGASVDLPDALDTSGTKLVSLYLRIRSKATIDGIRRSLGMKRVTLYSLLKTLAATDLVEREEEVDVRRERTSDGGTA